MTPSAVLAILGIVLLGAYLLETLYERTRVPDQLFLIVAGVVLGRAFGWHERAGVGSADRLFTQAAVVILVFHGAIRLELGKLSRGVGRAALLTTLTFASSLVFIALLLHFAFGQPWVPAAILGAALGGTGASVMLPMVRAIRLGEQVSAVLTIEAGLTDVLCIVVALALLSLHSSSLKLGATFERALFELLATIAFGAASAAAWIVVRAQLERHVRKDHLGTIAILFGMVGGAEWLGLSGAMAALVFGVVLANLKQLPGLQRLAPNRAGALTVEEQYFVNELSFVLKTFFFLYLGLILPFTDWVALLAAMIIVFIQHAVRPLSVRLSLPRAMVKDDVARAAALVPKGTVAVVLARVVVHDAMPGAAMLSDVALDAVLISMLTATALVFALGRSHPARLFGGLFERYASPPALDEAPAAAALAPPEPAVATDAANGGSL